MSIASVSQPIGNNIRLRKSGIGAIASVSQLIRDTIKLRKSTMGTVCGWWNYTNDISPYASAFDLTGAPYDGGWLTDNNITLGVISLLGPNYVDSLRASFGVAMSMATTVNYIDLYCNIHPNVQPPRNYYTGGFYDGSDQLMVLTSMTNGDFVEAQTFTKPALIIDLTLYFMIRLTLSTPVSCRWVKIVAPRAYGLVFSGGITGGFHADPTEIKINGGALSTLSISQPIGQIINLRRNT